MRIISGKFKGQALAAPKGQNTRPTTDARRESLFNILEHRFAHSPRLVLDLFAGSGSIGFEALSRGAERVVFVESDSKAIQSIKKNAEKLGVQAQINLITGERVDQWIKSIAKLGFKDAFDTVFCDPPYEKNWPKKVFLGFEKKLSSTSICFSEKTLLVIEESCKINDLDLPSSWHLELSRKQGAGSLHFYRKS